MNGICQDTTPFLGSSTGYREKRSHNRMIDSHWAIKHIALKNTFNVTYKGRCSITFFHIWLLMWRKNINPTRPGYQEMWHRSAQVGWAPQIHNQHLQSQALVSPWSHFSIYCIQLRSPWTSSKPPPMLLIWRWVYFYPARPENTEENQPTTNLKPRTFANTTVTNKKVKVFTRRLLFCSKLYDVSGMIQQPIN